MITALWWCELQHWWTSHLINCRLAPRKICIFISWFRDAAYFHWKCHNWVIRPSLFLEYFVVCVWSRSACLFVSVCVYMNERGRAKEGGGREMGLPLLCVFWSLSPPLCLSSLCSGVNSLWNFIQTVPHLVHIIHIGEKRNVCILYTYVPAAGRIGMWLFTCRTQTASLHQLF